MNGSLQHPGLAQLPSLHPRSASNLGCSCRLAHGYLGFMEVSGKTEIVPKEARLRTRKITCLGCVSWSPLTDLEPLTDTPPIEKLPEIPWDGRRGGDWIGRSAVLGQGKVGHRPNS